MIYDSFYQSWVNRLLIKITNFFDIPYGAVAFSSYSEVPRGSTDPRKVKNPGIGGSVKKTLVE